MKKKICLICIAILLSAALAWWIAWSNTALMTTELTVSSARLPCEFSGFRIAQVSDLHNAAFGAENETLLARLTEASPDMIVITGDLLDARRTDVTLALSFAQNAAQIAPTYYVTGNHEARTEEYAALEDGLLEAGVTVLRNRSVLLWRGEAAIRLSGVDDLDFSSEIPLDERLAELSGEEYTVLLSHRPERFENYVSAKIDLTFSGHAHGGQFRLPLIGGLFAPNQGLFPRYDAGLYSKNGSAMVVSRGLGNSAFPFRFNNRPELVIVTLYLTES